LLRLLPQILAQQPEDSPVQILVKAMATALAELDEALDATLRDHWVGLASGETLADRALAILERLGPYMGYVKEGSNREAYRLQLMKADRIWVDDTGTLKRMYFDCAAPKEHADTFSPPWTDAVWRLAHEAANRLEADLKNIDPADQEGLAYAWRDHWIRLAAGDLVLKTSATALTPPAPNASTLARQAEQCWAKVLIDHWQPVLRDHWQALGRNTTLQGTDALSRLAGLLGVSRLRKRHIRTVEASELQDENNNSKEIKEISEIREEVAAFRRRIPLTAHVLGYGLTSPESLLELAIVTVGAEPCRCRQRDRDTLIVYGMPPGGGLRCPAGCPGPSEVICPNRDQWVVEAWITDNPPQRRQWISPAPMTPATPPFVLDNPSLVTAIPELRLRALSDQSVRYPYLHNFDTGEVMFYAGEIKPGEILSLWPQVSEEERASFDSHEVADVYGWHRQYPSGSAVLIGQEGKVTPVSEKICFFTGVRFPVNEVEDDDKDAPRYAGEDDTEGVRFADVLHQGDVFGSGCFDTARFGSVRLRARMPILRPGRNNWRYGAYDRNEVQAIVGESSDSLWNNAPAPVDAGPAELILSWWVRPPARFRLCLRKNAWVRRAEERGALELLVRLVNKAKAAGVAAVVDFPEPVWGEHQPLADELSWMVHSGQRQRHVLESTLSMHNRASHRETQPLGEGALTWQGIFDTTLLDHSHFD
jgi:hypothetical protein